MLNKRLLQLIIGSIAILLMIFACYASFFQRTMIGCNCKQLPDTMPLQMTLGESFTTNEFLNWINQTYGTSRDRIATSQYAESTKTFDWKKDGIQYSGILSGSILTRAVANYGTRPAPKAECVVRCFGSPEQYQAYYTTAPPGYSLNFSLVFSDKGLIVSGVEFFTLSQEKPTSISANLPMNIFAIYVGGTVDDIFEQYYDRMPISYLAQPDLPKFKPWPRAWRDTKIEEFELDLSPPSN